MISLRKTYRSTLDGQTRRDLFLELGGGLLGLSLPGLLRASDVSQPLKDTGFQGRAKSVIFVMLFGGPSQLETFDLKPNAPAAIRGPYRPTPSRTPGLLICEHLPRLASVSHLFAIIRTMSHSFNDHSGGSHYIQTGKRWHVPIGGGFNPTPRDWPSYGSVVDHFCGDSRKASHQKIPPYFVIPNSLGRLQEGGQYRRPGEHAGWLGRQHNPITTSVDKRNLEDNPYWRDCSDAELTFGIEGLGSGDRDFSVRLPQRQGLLEGFERVRKSVDAGIDQVGDPSRRKALELLSSGQTRQALDLTREPEKVRDLYGRHLFGQSCLMARRLVEAGARFVTVHYDCCDGYGWDSHRNSKDVGQALLPTMDQGLAALLVDLSQRGLLQETMVVALGEMGRTPKANKEWGRDHWSTLFPALLAGGGVRAGYLHGQSDKIGAYALDPPVSPEDLAATLYTALGIDPSARLVDSLGREMTLVEEGKPVESLFGA